VVCKKVNLIISWALAAIIIERWCEKEMESILGISSLTEGRIILKNCEIPWAVAVILMKL
jgi:ethanolamine transporter EutH